MAVPNATHSGKPLTLHLPGWVPLNSYCSGAVTVAMVVRFFLPQMSFGLIYETVNPRVNAAQDEPVLCEHRWPVAFVWPVSPGSRSNNSALPGIKADRFDWPFIIRAQRPIIG